MKLNMNRIVRTSTSEQYNIFSDTLDGAVGKLDVHIKKTSIVCQVILLQNIDETYDVSSIKEYICSFLDDLIDEDDETIEPKEIILDIYKGTNIGLYSSKTSVVV